MTSEPVKTRSMEQLYDDTKYAIGGCRRSLCNNMESDETKFHLKQYDMTGDDRDRYQDFENEPDDYWVQELRGDDPHRFVTQRNKSNAGLYKNDLNCDPLSYSEDSITRQKTLVDHEQEFERERSCAETQYRERLTHDERLDNNAERRQGSRYLAQQQPEVEFQSFHKMGNNKQTMKCNTGGSLAANRPHRTYEEVNEPRFASYPNSSRAYGNQGPFRNSSRVYGNPEPITTSNVLNEAMYEPRCESYVESSRVRGNRAPAQPSTHHERTETAQSNISENILGQQMQLMQEMFRMLSTQNVHMRNQLENRSTLKVKPEKFSGSGTSFHSFMAQFENCCEINRWTAQEKLLMLRSSLTGNALSILWDIGTDRDYTYEELVEMLQNRYGSKGQAETFRMQLRARRQKRGETLSILMQDIRKLIAQAYPGQASEVIECIARDAFIDALADRELALQVLAKEPATLEKAFQTATKLESYNRIVYDLDKNKSSQHETQVNVIKNPEACKREDDLSNNVQMREMAEAIQRLSTRIEELIQSKSNVSEQAVLEKVWSHPQISSPDMIVCYGCGEIGHKKFECSRQRGERIGQRRESEAIAAERLQGGSHGMNGGNTFIRRINTITNRQIRGPQWHDEYEANIYRPKYPKSRGGRWTSPTARGCKYCSVWTRNRKEMTEHVKKAHDDILKSRRIEHEQREKIEEKERLLIEIQQRWQGDNPQRNIASIAEREMPSERRNVASIAEREMPSENWEKPELHLEFPEPQEAAVKLSLMKSAEPAKPTDVDVSHLSEKERRDAAVMQEDANVRSSLDERIEKMKEGSEGETSLALVWEGVKDREAATVASTTEGEGHRKSNASAPRRNVRVQTEADISTALLDISEERMIAAADVILAITVAHPTWPEEVILKLAREKRSIRELPDKLIRLLVYTTCMTKIQLQLEREAVEEEERKKATRGENKEGEESMEKEEAESRSRKEEIQGEGCQME